MVTLTVLLIRHGQGEDEAFDADYEKQQQQQQEEEDEDEDETEEQGSDEQDGEDSNKDDDDKKQQKRRRKGGKKSRRKEERKLLMRQRLDPSLTDLGYEQSQICLTYLFWALAHTCPADHRRTMAFFSAPLKACIGSALSMACAGIPTYEHLGFGLTTYEAVSAPIALPVIIINDLVASKTQVQRIGGSVKAIDAGLLHCAAQPYNAADKRKSPLHKCIRDMKRATRERVDEWKKDSPAEHEKTRRVVDVQLFRMPGNPFDLLPMTNQVNLLVDHVEPNKYMTPPRQGSFEPKRLEQDQDSGGGKKELSPAERVRNHTTRTLQKAVWQARRVGCDTVLVFVPAAVHHYITQGQAVVDFDDANPDHAVEPCTVTSLLAHVHNDGDASSIEFEIHQPKFSLYDLDADPLAALPETWPGPVGRTIPVPEGLRDPAEVPTNQWSRFPAPQPENIPPNYPDLPPFSTALDVPLPPAATAMKKHKKKDKTKKKKHQSPEGDEPPVEQAPADE